MGVLDIVNAPNNPYRDQAVFQQTFAEDPTLSPAFAPPHATHC